MIMKVAFLGWGSLYWNPGTLRISGNWNSDGPRLPIEFARIRENGRPSLVIYKAFPDSQTIEDVEVLWAEAADTDPEVARKNLAYREDRALARQENEPDFSERLARTAALVRVSDPDSSDEYAQRIKGWARAKGLDAVVWIALRSNWDAPPEPFRSLAPQPFSCENLRKYLRQLKDKQGDATLESGTAEKLANALVEAEKYIRLAPAQINTPCRGKLEQDPAFKWNRFTSTGIISTVDEKPAIRSAAPEQPSSESPPIPPKISPKPDAEPGLIEWLQRRALPLVVNLSAMFEDLRRDTGAEPKDAQSYDFNAEFKRVSRLLDFFMDEGHPFHIPDQIIDEVEAARELLKPGAHPSPEDRSKLMKAYRDLVTISQTSVMFDGMPPMRFWSRRSPWLWLLVLLGVIPSIVALIILIRHQYWYFAIIYGFLSVALFWGLYIFTGVVTNSKLNQIIRYCYLFTGVALAVSILPWAAPTLFPASPTAAPLGVLRGCAKPTKEPAANTGIPGEVLCDSDNYQWIINIGGVVEPWSGEKSATTQSSPGGGSAASGEGAAPLRGQVRGGVVVPLYVIVLALIGSAVSMTRRVPEYQRRAMDSQDPLTNVQARENLVFQIMQVLSAPLIAITVYYIIKPDTPMTSVVLGFGSGFASEPILLMIRSLVEKLSPAQAAEPSTIIVRVNPASVTLKPNQAQQFSAKVLGSANSEVTWQIDPSDVTAGTISQSGYYVAPGSPPSKTVTITASSAADRTKSGNASVTVKP
jgi:hypothetical protein